MATYNWGIIWLNTDLLTGMHIHVGAGWSGGGYDPVSTLCRLTLRCYKVMPPSENTPCGAPSCSKYTHGKTWLQSHPLILNMFGTLI